MGNRRRSLGQLALVIGTAAVVLGVMATGAAGSGRARPPKPPRTTTTLGSTTTTAPTTTTTGGGGGGGATFSAGQLQASTVGSSGCGTNPDGEPAIHVSRSNALILG